MIGSGTSENHRRVCSQLRLQRTSNDKTVKIENRHEYQIETHSKRIPAEIFLDPQENEITAEKGRLCHAFFHCDTVMHAFSIFKSLFQFRINNCSMFLTSFQ